MLVINANLMKKKKYKCFAKTALNVIFSIINGGESGIRTHGTCEGTHTFQACALNRSAISPKQKLNQILNIILVQN